MGNECCTADACKVDVDTDAETAANLNKTIQERIQCRLQLFVDAIEARKDVLEIDGLSINGVPCDVVTTESRVKILNHKTEEAIEVEIDAIITTPLEFLIPAIITGECIKLLGVTRIVGYYSRIVNWNKSKIGELKDRHKGKYSVSK